RPLADSGSGVRRAHPGGGPGLGLDPRGWDTLAASVATAVDRARDAGLEPTFHPHACTYVETPAEIDELLARTDVGLTLDTGHLILGGGDPLTGLRRWARRIDHLHLKDVRRRVPPVPGCARCGRAGRSCRSARETWTWTR